MDTRYYEIEYRVNGKRYSMIERPTKGWESQYPQLVLYRIESLVNAGAVIVGITEYR